MKICSMPEEELKWAEKDFMKIYQAFSGRSVKAPMKLIGIFEQQNSARGFFDHVPKPVYIGDKKKALAWVEGEASEKVLVEHLLPMENRKAGGGKVGKNPRKILQHFVPAGKAAQGSVERAIEKTKDPVAGEKEIKPENLPMQLVDDIRKRKMQIDEQKEYFIERMINPYREAF